MGKVEVWGLLLVTSGMDVDVMAPAFIGILSLILIVACNFTPLYQDFARILHARQTPPTITRWRMGLLLMMN
jgi:hypothetical protein